ncbi:MAG: GNAT family N-acetyltransferase [Acidimicrobiales bacterium]
MLAVVFRAVPARQGGSADLWWSRFEPVSFPGATIQEVALEELVPLRRRVLRDGRDEPRATTPGDALASTLHLGAMVPAGIVGCVSLARETGPEGTDLRLSSMAVAAEARGLGIGRALVDLAQRLAGGAGFSIWARARDSAIAFYGRCGFSVVGDGFIGNMDLPHHIIVWPSPGASHADRESVGPVGIEPTTKGL